jgi:DNA-binding NtrC family response regulator
MPKIMIVDDEENIIKSLRRTFYKQRDWDVESYTNADDALKRANTCIFDVIISDCRMPGTDGLEFLYQLKQLQPDAIRILLTGAVDINTLMQAVNKAGAYRFVAKPWDDNMLIELIKEGLCYRSILVENRMLADKIREQENEILALNKSMKAS